MVFSESGKFFTGCNYWASHAGTTMWSDWRPEVVEGDFKRLGEANITLLRVFPLWPVFQPLNLLRGYKGLPVEYRFGEELLPDTQMGAAGVSDEALEHFRELCALAEKHSIGLIIGLITGWMSGRLFVPPALEGLNVLTDPTAVMWEVRYVRSFVTRFINEKSIVAWDLGNECNCMASVASADEAYVWTSNIVGAIRSCDTSRPIISGMHGLLPDNEWTLAHQGELTDYLTTHPYLYFSPHCDVDPMNTIRTELHAVAQTLFYRGIGGKPCFVEECGTLGPMFGNEEAAADFVRCNLFTLWAHNCRGFLWWCANEQSHLKHAPYDWNAVERELGLFRSDGSRKPVLEVISAFTRFINHPDLEKLPPRIVDGVCILTKGQDTWGAAYISFILAKQAGLDIEFIYSAQPVPDSPLYIIPSISGDSSLSGTQLKILMSKVCNGSTLYLSIDSGVLSPFAEFFGMEVITRRKTGYAENVVLNSKGKETVIPLYSSYKMKMESTGAAVLAVDAEASPAFSCFSYGKGKVFFLAFPLEAYLTKISNAFGFGSKYSLFYDELKNAVVSKKAAKLENKNIGITEHVVDEDRRILVLVNYDLAQVKADLSLNSPWKINKFYYGSLELNKNDGAVLEIIK